MSDKTSINALDQVLATANSLTGYEQAIELITRVIDSCSIYSFAELLDVPFIKSMKDNQQYGKYYDLLRLFAYGNFLDYTSKQSSYPPLSASALMKLRHLSIISMAGKCRTISYATLCECLGILNIRELEDLIIEAFYADVIKGKLDQMNNQLEIDYAIGRDVTDEQIDDILTVLDSWCKNCNIALQTIETEVNNANVYKQKELENQASIDNEVSNLKKSLKLQSQEVESVSGGPKEGVKKPMKVKTARTSATANKLTPK